MVQALENGRQFQGNNDAELAGWLKAIAANVLLNELRKYKTQARDVDQEMSLAIDQSSARLEAVLAADQSTPSQHAVRDEQLLRQAAALEQLPADQRAALILHYLEELSLKETAERLGRSEAAVAGLVKRGLRELRRRMRE
jgi:RNA polymerase sigma-70 factor (ECF subfamily)